MRERELGSIGKPIGVEPVQLDEVVLRPSIAPRPGDPREAEHDPAVVGLEPEPEKIERFDLERRFLMHLSAERLEGMFVLVHEAAGQVPQTTTGIEGPAPEQDASAFVEADRLHPRNRVRVCDVPAGSAFRTVLDLLDSLAAERTEAPAVQGTHGAEPLQDHGAKEKTDE